jgi:hypothetical protein
MRHFVLFSVSIALACTPTRDPGEQPQSQSPVEGGSEYFLGYVSQTGIEHCQNGHEWEWLDVRSTLGFVPTGGMSLEPHMGKVVLARGEAGKLPPVTKVVEPKPCPPMQMRSDWMNSPKGIRVDRGIHPAIEYFEVASAEQVEGFEVVRDGDELRVSFTNPLPFELVAVALLAHYEGCYGKPGSTQRGRPDVPLGPGAAVQVRFPIFAEDEPLVGQEPGGDRVHLIHSIELRVEAAAGAPTLYVDVDAPVEEFGVGVECPERK